MSAPAAVWLIGASNADPIVTTEALNPDDFSGDVVRYVRQPTDTTLAALQKLDLHTLPVEARARVRAFLGTLQEVACDPR